MTEQVLMNGGGVVTSARSNVAVTARQPAIATDRPLVNSIDHDNNNQIDTMTESAGDVRITESLSSDHTPNRQHSSIDVVVAI